MNRWLKILLGAACLCTGGTIILWSGRAIALTLGQHGSGMTLANMCGLGVGVVALGASADLLDWLRRPVHEEKNPVANSRWATRADIEAAGIDQKTPVENLKTKAGRKQAGKEGIYLGIFADALGSIILRYRGQKHILCFGVPGANKSSGYAVCNLQHQPRSMINIDVKGQLAAITARARAKMGKVIILNPFGEFVEELPHLESIGWNPIAHIDPDSDTFESDAFCVAEAIIDKSEGGGNNKFFENNALYLLAGLIMWECYQFRGKARLSNVIALLSIREERDGKGQVIGGLLPTLRLMSNCENLAISTLGARLYGRLTDTNSKATSAEDVIDTAIGSARFLNDPNIRADMFKGGAIDFRALHYELTTIYLILPVGQLIDQAKWLRLFVNVALREFYKKKPKKPKLDPVLFLIDEFGNIGHLSQIESALTLSRDYRVQLWIFLQNLGQIKASYKDKWESFFTGAGAVTSFKTNDNETAEYLSKYYGNEERYVETITATGISNTPQAIPLKRPEEINRMKRGETIAVIEPCGEPIECQVPVYPETPFGGGLDPNPYYHGAKVKAARGAAARQGRAPKDRPASPSAPSA